MSFFPASPLDKTIGLAYEAFHYNVPSGMLPQEAYKPRAAGPNTLIGENGMSGFGRVYQQDLRSQAPVNLQGFGAMVANERMWRYPLRAPMQMRRFGDFGEVDGFGSMKNRSKSSLTGFGQTDVLTPIVNTLMATAGVQNALSAVVTAAWPQIQANMDASLKPIKIVGTITAVAAVAAAVFSYLQYSKF